jgi:thiol:disulfide interchange protein
MTDVLGALSDLMQTNMWLAPLLAFVAGVLTSFMPCSLSAIPLVIGYVGGTGQKSTQRAFRLSLTFALSTEQFGRIGLAVFLRFFRVGGVLSVCLGFTGKGRHQVFHGFVFAHFVILL